MIYSIGTMVVMSHAGQRELLKKRLWILWIIVVGIFLAVIKRLTVVIFPDAYFKILGWASLLWILTAVCWLLFILPKLFIIPGEDEFGKMHEQAKKNLNLKGS